ncbi:hypothetical protein TanjilG_22738 [Lupinus angustifolius]|uniref:Uncharacterized protein n=1 Tax=Lupinus angustifolius TaxID=3871 RepID=A0A4P1RER7_LUPAN|nr:PREDICTED: uncharacterized protein LOC109350355 [Lupinus angustifolius]OIW09464.1 hypothetical protein TanjilG_22738 [Lupinus angustifolius]
MDSLILQMATSKLVFFPNASAVASLNNKNINFRSNFKGGIITKIHVVAPNGSASSNVLKAIREEIIDKPVGLALAEKAIGNNQRCTDCRAKGAVLCATCAGSGLYIDSILESQGIIVKVRCLGCGGTGNMMCTECGGRGHLGPK